MTDKSRPSLRDLALRALSRREYSRQELQRKLRQGLESDELAQLEALLDEFVGRGWVSDSRYAEQVAFARRNKYGSLRVAQELRQQGVSDGLIEEALQPLRESELETAKAVWQKKFAGPPTDMKERAKQMRFLQSRGFSAETIRRVLVRDDD